MTQQEIQNYLTSIGYTEVGGLYVDATGTYKFGVGQVQTTYYYPEYEAIIQNSFLTGNTGLENWMTTVILDSQNPPA
jgi:hypothetical protein